MSDHENPQLSTVETPAHGEPGAEIAFSLFAVFRLSSSHPVVLDGRDVPGIVQELEDVTQSLTTEGVTVRGWYDVSGIRSDADLMVWLHGGEIEDLQWALRQLRRCALLRPLIRSWSAIGADQDDNPSVTERDPSAWVSCAAVQLPHGRAAAALPASAEVALHSYASASLTDAGWLLAAEADDPTALMALARSIQDAGQATAELRALFTGRNIEPAEIMEVLK